MPQQPSTPVNDRRHIGGSGPADRPPDTASSTDPLRLGFLIPSPNVAFERDARTALPNWASAHVSRVKLQGPNATVLPAEFQRAAEEIADVRPHAICYACSADTMHNQEQNEELRQLLEATCGCPATTLGEALVQELGLIGTRVALLAPYDEALTQQEAGFLEDRGFSIVRKRALALDMRRPGSLMSPEEIAEIACTMDGPDLDAIVIACAAFRGAEAVPLIATRTATPVLAVNSVSLRAALALSVTAPISPS